MISVILSFVISPLQKLNSKNIFLLDSAGAAISLIVTGGVLPFFSAHTGLQRNALHNLAALPFIYSMASFLFYSLAKRKPWMLLAVIFANFFYCLVSISLILFYDGLLFLGCWILLSEIFILLIMMSIEVSVYKRSFTK